MPKPGVFRLLYALAGPRSALVAVGWLMVLLVLGTLAQTHMGLFQAQAMYFSSWVLWLGPVPVPGGATTMAAMLLSLTLRIALYPWSRRHLGSLIAHGAVWLLLAGGFATAELATEGYIRVAEGEVATTLNSYTTPELAVVQGAQTVAVVSASQLVKGTTVTLAGVRLQVEEYFPNSHLAPRAEPVEDGGITLGALRVLNVTAKAPERVDERNRPTLIYRQLNAQGQVVARRVVFQNQPILQPFVTASGQSATLVVRPAQTPLPFQVQLEAFEQEYHPGTSIARHYASRVVVEAPAHGRWQAVIRMNEPLRLMGYTLYQASFVNAEAGGPETSILAVVNNQGWLFPYVASILLCVGLGVHVWQRTRRRKGLVGVLLAVVAGAWAVPEAHAQTPSYALSVAEVAPLAHLPIQHAGRIKPLGTYARVTLQTWGGGGWSSTAQATAQLAEILFIPTQSAQRPLFYLPSAGLANRLGLPRRPGRVYSYAGVAAALRPQFSTLQTLAALPEADRTAEETQLLTLAQHVQEYYLLSRSTSLVWAEFVVPPALATALGVTPSVPLSAWQLTPVQGQLAQVALSLNRQPTPAAQALALAPALKARLSEQSPGPFTIIPGQWGTPTQTEQWYAPWQVLAEGQGSPQSQAYLAVWQQLATAYRSHDPYEWFNARDDALQQAQTFTGVRPWALTLEGWYHAAHPWGVAGGLVALAALAWGWYAWRRRWEGLAWVLLGAAAGVQTLALAARVAILERPPVGTLYESVVFVATLTTWVAVGLAAWQPAQRVRWVGLGVVATGGLLLVAAALAASGGDTLGVLTAVLETHFWLTTHVLVITAGYGLSVLAGLYGLVVLAQRSPTPGHLFTTDMLVLAALLATALGTLLGGIWADQSWGRFWGWDPKENGALLLTLWLVAVLHMRVGKVGPLWAALAATALTPVVVAVSWFGVNLLGVGLHSYGFAKGTGLGLAGFGGTMCALVATLAWRWGKRA